MFEKLRFKDMFAVGLMGGLVYTIAYAPIDQMVKGAFIPIITLIAQYYWRKKESKPKE